MIRRVLIAAAAAALTVPAFAHEGGHGPKAEKAAPASVAVGAQAPSLDVTMTSVDGKQVAIADAKGEKGTLVVFTCNHCPFVKKWQDRLVAVAHEAQAKGIGVIAINSNDPAIVPDDDLAGMKTLAEAKAYKFPYVQDKGSAVATAFGAGRTPEVFLLDASGKVAYHGAIDDNVEDASAVKTSYLRDAVTALAAGTAIKETETKALGCSIKFPKAKT